MRGYRPLVGGPSGDANGVIPFQHKVAGRWYGALWFATIGGTSSAFTNQRLYFVPIYFGAGETIDGVQQRITAAGEASSIIRRGIYDSNGAIPTTLLAEWETLAGDAISSESVSVTPLAPGAGLKFLATVIQGAATTRPTMTQYGASNVTSVLVNAVYGTDDPGTGTSHSHFIQNSVSGAMPATATPTLANNEAIPLIRVRAA